MKPHFDLIALLSKILTDTPKLDGAACIDWPGLHDPANEGESAAVVASRHAAAESVCFDCPAMLACDQWAQTERPYAGVIAGRIPSPKQRGRPAAERRAS